MSCCEALFHRLKIYSYKFYEEKYEKEMDNIGIQFQKISYFIMHSFFWEFYLLSKQQIKDFYQKFFVWNFFLLLFAWISNRFCGILCDFLVVLVGFLKFHKERSVKNFMPFIRKFSHFLRSSCKNLINW